MNNQPTVTSKRKNGFFRPASLSKRKARSGWLFVLPFVIGIVFVYLPIILDSIWYSFNEIITTKGGGYRLEFQGFAYYSQALTKDPNFVQKLVSGIQQLVLDTPLILIFSLFIAVVLNQKMLGRAAFRAIFFIPVVLSTGLMEVINAADTVSQYMGSGNGISDGSGGSTTSEIVSAVDIERLFADLKVGSELVEYVAAAVNNIYDIVNRSGVQMLIFLAGLQSISPAIYEASSIEGATAWETFWKITFPMISPMILVNAVYTIIDSFTTSKNVVMTFITGIYDGSSTELATAMSWVYFLMILAIIGLVALIASSFVFYQKRN